MLTVPQLAGALNLARRAFDAACEDVAEIARARGVLVVVAMPTRLGVDHYESMGDAARRERRAAKSRRNQRRERGT